METSVARWGNSLALRIPRPIASRLGLDEGRIVELSVEEDRLVVRARDPGPRLEELLAGITAENLPEESFDDAAAGREAL